MHSTSSEQARQVVSKSIDWFNRSTDLRVVKNTPDDMELRIDRTNPCFMVALRGILMDELPSMRCEHLFMEENSSVISDHDLAKRLGLMHIGVDSRLFKYEYEVQPGNETMADGSGRHIAPTQVYEPDYVATNRQGHGCGVRPGYPVFGELVTTHFEPDPRTTLVFEIDATCYFDEAAGVLRNQHIHTHDLKWKPIGDQLTRISSQDALKIRPGGVLLMLAEGQRIKFTVWAVKGTAYEHAKWQTARAYFTHVPTVVLNPFLRGKITHPLALEKARTLVRTCSDKAFHFNEATHELTVDATKHRRCVDCQMLLLDDKSNAFENELIKMPVSETTYAFHVHSIDGQSPVAIIQEAFHVIRRTLTDIRRELTAEDN